MKTMSTRTFLFFVPITLIASLSLATQATPDGRLTPGVLCTAHDPNYKGPDYPERIARCNRNVDKNEKLAIAAEYGKIPESEWPKYEFDHLIPLCAGGSDDIKNLWPEPIDQAHEKDKLEVQICTAMRAGTLTQTVAIQKVRDFIRSQGANLPTPVAPVPPPPPGSVIARTTSADRVTCISVNDPKLIVRFRRIDESNLEDLSVSLFDGTDHEVISAHGMTRGIPSLARRQPLLGLTRFTIAYAHDRFDFYTSSIALPIQDGAEFTAYLKLSFESTYPNLEEMRCSFDGGVTGQAL